MRASNAEQPIPQQAMVARRIRVLGVDVDLFKAPDLIEFCEWAVSSGKRVIVGNHNLHSIYLFHRRPRMRRFFDSCSRIFIDGMPIALAGKALGLGVDRSHRMTSLDWMKQLLPIARAREWRVYYLGSAPETFEKGLVAIQKQYPGLRIRGHHGYFDKGDQSLENARVLREIEGFRPNVLFVGMGMPIQEEWIHRNLQDLPPCLVFTMGAYLDYLAGAIGTPPRWMGRCGLEWAYRLFDEPKRLWARYLIEPVFLVPLFLADVFRRLFLRR